MIMKRNLLLTITLLAFLTGSVIAQVAHFPFDEDAMDVLSEINSTAEATGVSFVADNARGDVMELDGTNGFITYPGNDVYNYDAITYNLWFRWTTSVANQWWVRIFDFGIPFDLDPHPGNHDVVFLTTYQDGLLKWHIHSVDWTDGMDTILISKEPIVLDEWYMLTCTHDADSARLYLNGEIQDSRSVNGVKPSDLEFTNMYLGRSNWADPLFQGKFDEFTIYDEVLSQEAITDLYVFPELPSSTNSLIIEGIDIYAYGSNLVVRLDNALPNAALSVYNLMGVEVMHETDIGTNLEISSLNTGIYIVRVVNGAKATTAKVFIR